MKSSAKTVGQYLKDLPADRRKQVEKARQVILKNLPKGYIETMQYGMIGYSVPLSVYPQGYLGDKKVLLPYAALASQKNHMAVYLNNIYTDKKLGKWFVKEYKKSGKKMDVGKSCVRFRKVEDMPLTLIGRAIAKTSVKEFISKYQQARKR